MNLTLAEIVGVFDTDTGTLKGLAPASRLAQTYTPISTATSVPFSGITGDPSDNTLLAAALNSKAVNYPGVTLPDGTVTMTRSLHMNRQVTINNAGAVNLPVDVSTALRGDFMSVAMVGGGSVTLTGVTPLTGRTLTAQTNQVVEAYCFTDGSMVALTPTPAAAATGDLTVALTNADLTSNALNLTSAHMDCVLDCSAITVPAILYIQTDAAGGYDTTSSKLLVLGSTTNPIGILPAAGATMIGGAQVVEAGGSGEVRRNAANSWALIGHRRSGLAMATSLSSFASHTANGLGSGAVSTFGMAGPNIIDSCTLGSGAATTDGGTLEYGNLRRVRMTGNASTVGKGAGYGHTMGLGLGSVTSAFPVSFMAGIGDAIGNTGSFIMGLTSNISAATGLLPVASLAISAGSNLDMIALAADPGDANMQLMCRTGGGTTAATKVDLGASFPHSQYVGYQLTLYKNNAGTGFLAVVQNLNTKAITAKVMTSNLPRLSPSYYGIAMRGNQNNAVAPILDYGNYTYGAA